jgi:hypothetical protein
VKRAVTERQFFFLIASIGGLAILSSTMSKTPVLPLFANALGATPQEIGWIVIASTPFRDRGNECRANATHANDA